MVIVVKVFVLVGLIKLLLEIEKPLLCAGIYAVIGAIASAIFWEISLRMAVFVGISFVLALIYFWLLNRFRDSMALFILILVLGLCIGMV